MHNKVRKAIELILANLGEPLRLNDLAMKVSCSPSYLHRLFKADTGETMAKFIERRRINQAAHDIIVRDATILEIAIGNGYSNHETFCRAFQRQLHITASAYRTTGQFLNHPNRTLRNASSMALGTWQISRTRLQQTRAISYCAHRHIGNYEHVPATLWRKLQNELSDNSITHGTNFAICWDSPSDIAANELRFDACVLLKPNAQSSNSTMAAIDNVHPKTSGLRAETNNKSELQTHILAPNTWAVTKYSGSFEFLTTAYEKVIQQVLALSHVGIKQGPVLEVYHSYPSASQQAINYLEIYIPVHTTEDSQRKHTEKSSH